MPCKCCDCMNVGNWQIKGAGGGAADINVVIGNGTLNNLTDTWTPLWYTSLGPNTYNLVVTCDKKEESIDTWTSTIVLCATEADRYPEHTISLATTLPDPCKSCGLAFGGETLPLYGVGHTFTAGIDNEWSNQLNWKDVDGNTPSGTLPGKTGPFDDDIVIKGDVLSCSLDTMPQVYDLTTDGGNIGISLSAVTATISGSSKVLLNGDCATGGFLYVTDPASFIDSSANEGTVVGNAVFEDSSQNNNVISGNATLRDKASFVENATNSTKASCTGDLEMNDYSVALDATIGKNATVTGAVGINLPSIEGCDIGQNLIITANSGLAKNCVVSGDLLMSGSASLSHTAGFINVTGNVVCSGGYFGESSQIQSGAGGAVLNFPAKLTTFTISGPSFFFDKSVSTVFGAADLTDSFNHGTITGNATFTSTYSAFTTANEGTVSGDAAFENCSNAGTVSKNASFNVTVGGLVAGNTKAVTGNATFTGSAINTGTVGGVAAFTNASSNSGPLTGSPTFANQSTNTGTFTATATFNGDSINTGTITGNQVFNDNSQHKGSIIGNATFNGTSSQLGTVSGNVVCNTSGPCTTQP